MTKRVSARISIKVILILTAAMFFLSSVTSLILLFNYFDTTRAYRNNLYDITAESYEKQFLKNLGDLSMAMQVTVLDQAIRTNIFRKDVNLAGMLPLGNEMRMVIQSNTYLLCPKSQIYSYKFFTYLPGDGCNFFPLESMAKEAWYQGFTAAKSLDYACFLYSPYSRSFQLVIVQAINDFSSGQPDIFNGGETCYQAITVDIGSLMSKSSETISDVPAYAFLLDDQTGDMLYYASDKLKPLAEGYYSRAEKPEIEYSITLADGDVNYIPAIRKIPGLNASMVFLFESVPVAADAVKSELLYVGLTLTLFVVLTLILLVFYVNYSKRIRALVNMLDSFDETAPAVPEEPSGGDEIEKIHQHAILMQNRIRNLIREEYTVKLQMISAQHEALIACINPHFLYNTLNTISAMATLEGAEDTNEMIYALSGMFRYSADVSKKLVTLGDELKNIADYLHIQGIRYANSFTYKLSVPDELLPCSIPKLILQPLVENCFKHGFEGGAAARKNEIQLCAVQEGSYLKLYVLDNGQGIDKNRLETLRQNLQSTGLPTGEEIGLGNVHRRLQLIYGPGCGIDIFCKKDGYTCVKVTIPYAQQ